MIAAQTGSTAENDSEELQKSGTSAGMESGQPQKTGTTAGNDERHAGKDMENSKNGFRTGAVDRTAAGNDSGQHYRQGQLQAISKESYKRQGHLKEMIQECIQKT